MVGAILIVRVIVKGIVVATVLFINDSKNCERSNKPVSVGH